ncbi:MAG: HNH endonuclease, partial [Planctomycetota bacterium]
VTAKVSKRDGDTLELTTLKPDIWLKQNGVEVGKRTLMDIPVADAHNEALITAIHPAPEIKPGPGRVVMSTFKHTADEILELTIEGEAEPIRTTPDHPFWSEDEQWFVRADQLEAGVSLRTPTRPLPESSVVGRRLVRGHWEVINLEVHGESVYLASTSGCLVHNTGEYSNSKTTIGYTKKYADGFEQAFGNGSVYPSNSILVRLGKIDPSNPAIVTVKGRRPQNAKYAGSSRDGVEFNKYGFPDYRPHMYDGSTGLAEVRIKYTGRRADDFAAANKAAGFGDSTYAHPSGYIWHHVEDVTDDGWGTLILVKADKHSVKHTGGVALYEEYFGVVYG